MRDVIDYALWLEHQLAVTPPPPQPTANEPLKQWNAQAWCKG